MTWPRHLVLPLPDHIGDAEASVLEALGIGLNAIDLGAVEPSSRVAVTGCGPIRLLVIARVAGGGSDRHPRRRIAAAPCGGSRRGWRTTPGRSVGRDRSGRRGGRRHRVLGDDAAVARAARLARPGGVIVLVGIPDGDQTSFPAAVARRKGLTFVMCHRMRPSHLERAVALVGCGAIDVAPLITHRYPLDQVDRAFEALIDRRGLKVVVLPNPER